MVINVNDKDLDKYLKEKAKDFEVKNYTKLDVDEIVKKAEKKKKNIVLRRSIAVSICACLCIAVLVYFALYKTNNNVVENGTDVITEGKDENNKEYGNLIKLENVVGTYLYENEESGQTNDWKIYETVIIKVTNFQNNEIVDEVPNSKIEAEVIEIIKGEIAGKVEFILDSCYVKIGDLSNSLKEKIGYDGSQDLDKESYIRLVANEVMLNSSYPEIGKYYIVCLTYDGESYRTVDTSIYCFNEFDIETRKVKIGDEWEDLNLDFII